MDLLARLKRVAQLLTRKQRVLGNRRKGVVGVFVVELAEGAERFNFSEGVGPLSELLAVLQTPRFDCESEVNTPHEHEADRVE